MALRRTLADLVLAVRDNVDEATVAFWTAAQMRRFVNRAITRTWTEVRKVQDDFFLVTRLSTDGTVYILDTAYACSSFQISSGTTTRDYTLPPDLVQIKLIECITSSREDIRFVHRDLTHPTMRAAREITTAVDPGVLYFDIVGERTLTVAPYSDTALDLRLTYIPIIPELGLAHPVSGITRSGTTATLTTQAAHGLTTGDTVTVAGAVETGYNLTATITVTTTTAFTYTVAAPSTPATGTITYTSDYDTLQMPHGLAAAVEEYASASALKMDRSAEAAVWEQTGNATVARFMGALSRQSQDPVFVQGYLE